MALHVGDDVEAVEDVQRQGTFCPRIPRARLLDYPPLLTVATGMRPGQLTDWNAFEKTRKMIESASLDFGMKRLE